MTTFREIDTALVARLTGIVLEATPPRTVTVPVFMGNPSTKEHPSRPLPVIIIEQYDVDDEREAFESRGYAEGASEIVAGQRLVYAEDATPKIYTYSITAFAGSSSMQRQLLAEVERRMKVRSALATPDPCHLFRRPGMKIMQIGTEQVEYRMTWLYDVHAILTYPASIEPRFVVERIELEVGTMDSPFAGETVVIVTDE